MANQVTPQGERPYVGGGFGGSQSPGFKAKAPFGTNLVDAGRQRQVDTQVHGMAQRSGGALESYFANQTGDMNDEQFKLMMQLAGYTSGSGSGSQGEAQVPQELIDAQRRLLQQQMGGNDQESELARQMIAAQMGGLDQTDQLTREDLAAQDQNITRQAGMEDNMARNDMAAAGSMQSGMARQTLGSDWVEHNNPTDATRYGGSGRGTIQDQLEMNKGGLYREGQGKGLQSSLQRLGYQQDLTKTNLAQQLQNAQLQYQLQRLNYVNAPNTNLL